MIGSLFLFFFTLLFVILSLFTLVCFLSLITAIIVVSVVLLVIRVNNCYHVSIVIANLINFKIMSINLFQFDYRYLLGDIFSQLTVGGTTVWTIRFNTSLPSRVKNQKKVSYFRFRDAGYQIFYDFTHPQRLLNFPSIRTLLYSHPVRRAKGERTPNWLGPSRSYKLKGWLVIRVDRTESSNHKVVWVRRTKFKWWKQQVPWLSPLTWLGPQSPNTLKQPISNVTLELMHFLLCFSIPQFPLL